MNALLFDLVARTCSLIFIVLDVLKPMTDKKIIEKELEGFGIRLNKKPPAIIFKKKEKGGINMTNTVPLTQITQDEVKAVLSEYRIHNADISFKEDSSIDDLIDVVEVSRYNLIVFGGTRFLKRPFSFRATGKTLNDDD